MAAKDALFGCSLLKIGPQAQEAQKTDFVGWSYKDQSMISKATKSPEFDDCLGMSQRYLRQFKELHKGLL